MVSVQIDEDTLVDMLMERVEVWTEDEDVRDLFKQMYEHYAESGCFEGAELDVMGIVDNDYVNWCRVIYDNDEDYKKLLELHDDGEYDVSMENVGCDFIEAVSKDRSMILVR